MTDQKTEKGQERAFEIICAAQNLLAESGFAGLSMRAVAARVGISLSNVQHYYSNKEALVEALLTRVMDEFQANIDRLMLEMKDSTQLDRFKVIIDLILNEIRQPKTYGVLAEIYVLSNRNEFAARLAERVYARERKQIFKLIYGLQPALSVQQCKGRAAMMVVQIHGLVSQLASDKNPSLSRKQLEDAAKQSFLLMALAAPV